MNVSGWAPPAPGRVAGGIPWLAPSGHLLKYPWSTADEPSFRLTSWVAVVVTLHIVAISKNTVIVYHHHQLTDMLPVAARKCLCHWASTAAHQPLIVFSMWWNSDGVMKNPSGFKESPMACVRPRGTRGRCPELISDMLFSWQHGSSHGPVGPTTQLLAGAPTAPMRNGSCCSCFFCVGDMKRRVWKDDCKIIPMYSRLHRLLLILLWVLHEWNSLEIAWEGNPKAACVGGWQLLWFGGETDTHSHVLHRGRR